MSRGRKKYSSVSAKGLVSPKKENKLDILARRSGYIIFEAKSAFPLDFTKHAITICPNRITLSYKYLTGRDEYPLPIQNVTGAWITKGFLYSNLYIETFGLERPEPLTRFKVNDARLARRYILALVECYKNNIDLSEYSLTELRSKLKKIGTVRHDSREYSPL